MMFGLSESTINKFYSVFVNYPEIEEVIVYGSRAKGNFRNGSDIDISLKGNNLTPLLSAKVWLDIDELNTPYLVDLSIYELLSSESLKSHIERIGKVFYKKSNFVSKVAPK